MAVVSYFSVEESTHCRFTRRLAPSSRRLFGSASGLRRSIARQANRYGMSCDLPVHDPRILSIEAAYPPLAGEAAAILLALGEP